MWAIADDCCAVGRDRKQVLREIVLCAFHYQLAESLAARHDTAKASREENDSCFDEPTNHRC